MLRTEIILHKINKQKYSYIQLNSMLLIPLDMVHYLFLFFFCFVLFLYFAQQNQQNRILFNMYLLLLLIAMDHLFLLEM